MLMKCSVSVIHNAKMDVSLAKGGTKKSGLLCSNPYNSSTRRPTLTCYIPNQWKFNEDFTELYRFEIAALIEEDNLA